MVISNFDKNKLQVFDELGSGSFGRVTNATYDNLPIVFKSALLEDYDEVIINEYKVLEHLQNIPGIPLVSFRFTYEGRESFMMQKLDSDLLKLVGKSSNKIFSLETTLRIALQVLKILESVHSHGIIHNDIKPNNLMIGTNDPNKIYLIDFGLANIYLNEGKHIKETEGNLKGTLAYCSANCLRKRSLSRRDDLESLAYVLMEFRSGKLIWDEIVSDPNLNLEEKCSKLIEYKTKPAKELCAGLNEVFATFLEKVRILKFTTKPDYDDYNKMFGDVLKKIGKTDAPINWPSKL